MSPYDPLRGYVSVAKPFVPQRSPELMALDAADYILAQAQGRCVTSYAEDVVGLRILMGARMNLQTKLRDYMTRAAKSL